MARRENQDELDFGSDSFLDIVANIVGILIILVVVVGARIQNAPLVSKKAKQAAELVKKEAAPSISDLIDTTPDPKIATTETTSLSEAEQQKLSAAEKALSASTAKLISLEQDRVKTVAELKNWKAHTALRHIERTRLAYLVALLQSQMEEKQQHLSEDKKKEFESTRRLAAAQSKLNELTKNIETVQKTPSKIVQVKHVSTPLSRTVFEQEEHFRIRGGRIAYVPTNELTELIRGEMHRQAKKLRTLQEVTLTLGPIDGFRAEYELGRVNIGGGSGVELRRWSAIPVFPTYGEDVERALSDGSQFRQKLKQLSPRKVTLTVWVYPDSFKTYRKIQDELHRLGYHLASRPLPADMEISFSPYGSRSSAQ